MKISWLPTVAGLAVAGTVIRAAFFTPLEARQGAAQKIFYIHVPAAWVAFLAFGLVAIASGVFLWLRDPRLDRFAESSAEVGVVFTTVVLITGPMWAKPIWGTYWAWDARMTSTLILLFLYVGVIALRNAIEDPRRADRACALLALVGAVNVPIIYFSVRWWNTLHQGSSISLTAAPTMAMTMVTGILVMTAAAWCYTIAITLVRVQAIIVERERGATWLESMIDLAPTRMKRA
jgi:heme exporter protein C